jgi:hypothetical protein
LAQVGKHGVIGAVIVPAMNILKKRYKSARYKNTEFSISCNLHEWPSCILHFALLSLQVLPADTLKDCPQAA